MYEIEPQPGVAADLRVIAVAVRTWGDALHAAQELKRKTGWTVIPGFVGGESPPEWMRRDENAAEYEAARRMAEETKAVLLDAIGRAAQLVKNKLRLLTYCADSYGCSARSQKVINWLKVAVARHDVPFAFGRYRDHDIVEGYGHPRYEGDPLPRCILSIFADEIDAWAEKAGQESPEPIRKPQVELDEERDRISVRGQWYDVTVRQREMLAILLAADGSWVAGKNIGGRPDKTRKATHSAVASIVQTDKAKGYRIDPTMLT